MRVLTKEEKIEVAKSYHQTVKDIPLEVSYMEILDMWIIHAGETVLIDYLEKDEAYKILEEIKKMNLKKGR